MPIFISFIIVAVDPLDKLYKSAREQRHDDRSIRGQTNRALYQTDNKWNDINMYGLLDDSGNLVTTRLSRFFRLFFLCLIILFFPLDNLYKSAREQRFDDRNIRHQTNRAFYEADDEWNDIDSLLDELGNLQYSTATHFRHLS